MKDKEHLSVDKDIQMYSLLLLKMKTGTIQRKGAS